MSIQLGLLETDPMNVRDAPKIDDEFRNSVGKGIIEPLIVRPVASVEQERERERLLSVGKQYVVTAGVRRFEAARQAGLDSVPCMVSELGDLDAMALSIAENKHRRDIPAWRWAEIVQNFYGRLEGAKDERVKRMAEMTGMGYSTIYEYLLLSELPDHFRARLKDPEERSFSEKEALAKTSPARSEEKAPIGESGKETAPSGPPRVPEKVMVKLVQDEDFKRLIKKDPAKAHELATVAAEKGRERVGEVLRLVREPQRREKLELKPVPFMDIPFEFKIRLFEQTLEELERYRRDNKLPDLQAAAVDILFKWIRRNVNVDYYDLPAAVQGIIITSLSREGYAKTARR
jgi:ParB/RepB/Spo0J family partition protein